MGQSASSTMLDWCGRCCFDPLAVGRGMTGSSASAAPSDEQSTTRRIQSVKDRIKELEAANRYLQDEIVAHANRMKEVRARLEDQVRACEQADGEVDTASEVNLECLAAEYEVARQELENLRDEYVSNLDVVRQQHRQIMTCMQRDTRRQRSQILASAMEDDLVDTNDPYMDQAMLEESRRRSGTYTSRRARPSTSSALSRARELLTPSVASPNMEHSIQRIQLALDAPAPPPSTPAATRPRKSHSAAIDTTSPSSAVPLTVLDPTSSPASAAPSSASSPAELPHPVL